MAKNVKRAKPEALKTIRKAMKAAVKDGNGIDTGRWGTHYDDEKGYFVSDGEGACALGALLIYKNGSLKYKPTQGRAVLDKKDTQQMAAYVLGVDDKWVGHFICGFDGDGAPSLDLKCDGELVLEDDKLLVRYDDGCEDDSYEHTDRKLQPKKDLKAQEQEYLRAWQMGRKLAEEFA